MSSLDEAIFRAAILSIADFACNGSIGRQKGDPIFERVTERRQSCWKVEGKTRCYSGCGDLPHFAAWLLTGAIRYNEPIRSSLRWINRAEAWGWKTGWNLIKLHSETGSAWTKHTKRDAIVSETKAGDIWYFGEAGTGHVCIVKRIENDQLFSFDYGGFFKGSTGKSEHGGKANVRSFREGSDGRIKVFDSGYPSGRTLVGKLDLFSAISVADTCSETRLEAALVPEGFELGIPTDNPYFPPYF